MTSMRSCSKPLGVVVRIVNGSTIAPFRRLRVIPEICERKHGLVLHAEMEGPLEPVHLFPFIKAHRPDPVNTLRKGVAEAGFSRTISYGRWSTCSRRKYRWLKRERSPD